MTTTVTLLMSNVPLWASVNEGEEQLAFFFLFKKKKRIVLVQTQNGTENFFI